MVRIIDYFVNENLKSPRHILFRSRSLIGAQYFTIFVAFLLILAEIILNNNFKFAIFIGIICLFANMLIIKIYGNLLVAANIFSGFTFLTITYLTFDSGGLFSDNCLWLILVPLISLLFGEKISGFTWLFLCIFFFLLLFIFDIYPLEYVKHLKYSPLYYTVGYIFLFIVVFAITFIFKLEQSQVAQSLQLQNKALASMNQEIADINQKISETTQKLERSNQELEQFAYVASHDLKEPLRMITLYTQMIQRKIKQHLDKDTEEFMGYVTDGAKRMQQLLDDLLEYSRLGKKGTINAIDLNDILHVVQQNLKIPIVRNLANIEVATLPKVNAVFSEMVQLFQNIIGNSLKFCREGVQPHISISISEVDSNFFTIKISDNGIGMENENFSKIFNLFERLHNRDKYDGTGIGLATCKKVMENLGGTISVESELNIGSTFYLKFPSAVLSNEKATN